MYVYKFFFKHLRIEKKGNKNDRFILDRTGQIGIEILSISLFTYES